PALKSHQPAGSPWARRKAPPRHRPMPSHGSARLMVASIQARTPGSPLGRGTLNDQNGSSAGGDLDPGASGQIGAFGLPKRVTDPHLAAAVLDRLFDEQRAANVLLTPAHKDRAGSLGATSGRT